MACTKQTAHKSKPTTGLATYQGGTVSSSSEEQEKESTLSEMQGERESSEQAEQPRTSRKRKRGDRTASLSLSLADHTHKSRKVAVEYSTDETDEDKIPEMGEGIAFPRKMKTVKLTLPATPSQVHLARSFVEWFAYYGMRPGMRAALVSRKWTDRMIDEFIENFRQKHGFGHHIGPHTRLIERDTGVCGFYTVPQGLRKPLAPPGGRYWIPPSSGISGSPGT